MAFARESSGGEAAVLTRPSCSGSSRLLLPSQCGVKDPQHSLPPKNSMPRSRSGERTPRTAPAGNSVADHKSTAQPLNRDSHGGSAAKALDILEAVARHNRPPTASEVAAELDLPSPTGHRVVATLKELGFLKRDLNNSRLIEGDRLVSLALDVLAAAARRAPRHSILESLADETGETCNLGVSVNGKVVYLDRVETQWPLGLRFEPGSTVPIHCTALGKMFLSQWSSTRLNDFLRALTLTRYTANTITDPEQLVHALQRIRDDDFSIDNQEFMSGVVCIAVPIRNPRTRVCAGLAISAPEARLSLDKARSYVPLLQKTAQKLSLTLET